jgi:hypothetical protein
MPTHRADYRYIVKELPYKDNQSVWAIECAPMTQQLPYLRNSGCMYIELKPDVSEQDAKELKRLMNEKVAFVTVID